MNEFLVVYSAEIARRLRSRIFLMGLLIGAFGLFALIKLPQIIETSYDTQTKKIELAGDPALIARAAPLLAKDFTVVATRESLQPPSAAALRALGAKALVTLAQRRGHLQISAYAVDPGDVASSTLRHDLLPLSVELATNLSPSSAKSLLILPIAVKTVSSKFDSAQQSDSARTIAYLLLFLLYLLIVMNSQIVMSSVAEEKTSRIAELLIASVSPTSLLAGKVAASITLACIQLAVWVVVTMTAGGTVSPGAPGADTSSFAFSLHDLSQAEIGGFIVFFMLAFLQTVTLFAAAASLVNRTEDLGSIAGPMMLPVIGAFFIAILALRLPDSPIVYASSFIPVLSPFVMFTRMSVTNVPAWQIAVAVSINLLAIWAIAILGAKLYRIGMLLYGRPPKFSQLWTSLRAR